jgi:TolA-binding protein
MESTMARSRLLRFAALPVVLLGLASVPAHAANKDMIQLQTQVQQLIDAVARLQQSNDESMGVLKDLVQQTADSVNKMGVTVNGMQLKMQNQQDAVTASDQQLSGQIQSLNDSVDELKARLDKMQTALNSIQSQQQSTAAALTNMTPATGSAVPAGNETPASTTVPSGNGIPGGGSDQNSGNPAPPSGGATLPPSADAGGPAVPGPAPAARASGDMYSTAYSDYIAGRNSLASSEFNELIKAYPDDNLSGNGYFYLGEIDRRTQKPSAAIKNYDHVIEHYADNAKIPAAELHKGELLIAIHQNEAAVREFRELIQRYPVSPEASQARTRLNAMGVRIRG